MTDFQRTLPTIGAAIILLSLPLDGLFQHVVSYPLTTIPDSSNTVATLSRTVLYDPRPEYRWRDGYELLQRDSELQSLLQPFWQSKGFVPAIEFACGTSKCSYESFYTLALDFQCANIMNFVDFGCRSTSAEWLSTFYTDINITNSDLRPKIESCGWHMKVPNHDSQLMSGYEVQSDGSLGEVLSTRMFPLMDVRTNEPYFRSIDFSVKSQVVDFILATTPGGFDGARSNNTPVVTECEVHWVVQKLKAEVSLGVLSEEVLETLEFEVDETNKPFSPWDGFNSYTWSEDSNYSMLLNDSHSPSGLSTFGLDNTTAKKVWEVWAEIAPSTFNLPAVDNPFKTGPIQIVMHGDGSPVLRAVSDPRLPWETPNNVSQHMADIVKVMNQVVRRNAMS